MNISLFKFSAVFSVSFLTVVSDFWELCTQNPTRPLLLDLSEGLSSSESPCRRIRDMPLIFNILVYIIITYERAMHVVWNTGVANKHWHN